MAVSQIFFNFSHHVLPLIGVHHLINLLSRTKSLSRIPFHFQILFSIAAPALFKSPLLPFPPAGVPRFRVFRLFMRAPSFFGSYRIGHQREQDEAVTSTKKRGDRERCETEFRTVDPWRRG